MSTIKDIAGAMGVPAAAVSNALNGHANGIEEAAAPLNYIPNSNAQLMKSAAPTTSASFSRFCILLLC